MLRAFLAFLTCALWAASAAADARAPVRILFIGNSLVATTDVPGRLARLALAMGREVEVQAVTAPDTSLEDHWRDGRALARIGEGWNYVVLQQGPSSRRDSRASLLEYARRFAVPIRAAGARPVIFMAWPSAARPGDFAEAIRSHRLAAEEIDAILAPAGEAWLRAMSASKRIGLYADGLHASKTGGDLAVLACWFAIFPAGPQEFDEAYVRRLAAALAMPDGTADILLDAATRAVDEPVPLK